MTVTKATTSPLVSKIKAILILNGEELTKELTELLSEQGQINLEQLDAESNYTICRLVLSGLYRELESAINYGSIGEQEFFIEHVIKASEEQLHFLTLGSFKAQELEELE